MNNILLGVLEEELERNLQKQRVFNNEFIKYPKGSLSIIKIHGDQYVYRKYRDGNKIVSKYIGLVNSEPANEAYKQRDRYLKLKQDIKELKKEELELRKVINKYSSNS